MVVMAERLRRKFVALVYVGLNPTNYPKLKKTVKKFGYLKYFTYLCKRWNLRKL